MRDETATLYVSKDSWPRRLARPLVVRLPRAIRPNHVTVARLLIALGACALLATGERSAAVWAGVLWLLAVFLDRVDGELARVTGTSSWLGHRLDYGTDLMAGTAFFVALGIGLGDTAGIWMGIVAGVAMLVTQIVAELIDREQVESGEKAFAGWAGFDPEDSHACFAPIVWLGWNGPFLTAAAIGAPLFALSTIGRFAASRRERAARR